MNHTNVSLTIYLHRRRGSYMQYVLITGASRGLGKVLLQTFWKNGDFVFPLIRSEEVAMLIKDNFSERCAPIICDVVDESAIEEIRATVSHYTEKLDIVINNAGVAGDAYRVEDISKEEIMKLFEIHCFGALNISKSCIPFLKNSSRGKIINVSSRLGSLTKMSSDEFRDRDFSYSYKIAKASQNMMSICLNNELSDSSIGVISIHPSQINTESGSSDAKESPYEAGVRIMHWINSTTESDFGKFHYPGVTEFNW